MEIKTVSLRNYSSLRAGGEGKLVVVTSTAQLVEAMMYAKRESQRVHVIGEGTNTFFGNSLENILFIKMNIKGVSFEEQDQAVLLTAYAGENWDTVVKLAVEKNLWGIENLSYIPGTVGAAPVQNIGAYGTELKDTFGSLAALDRETLQLVEISNEGCTFGYRDSLFKHHKDRYIIISVTLKLSKIPKPVLAYRPLDTLMENQEVSLQGIRDLVIATRTSKLPDYNLYPNNGSFFKNPIVSKEVGRALALKYEEMKLIDHEDGYKIPAAWLIEHVANMKGVRIGDVGTWPAQPLVIINYGNTTAEGILNFSDKIIKKIEDTIGIRLEREVNYIH